MTNPADVTFTLRSTPDQQGLQLEIRNNSSASLEVTVPDPYSGVQLFDLTENERRKASLFAWKREDFIRILKPANSLMATFSLAPFWAGIRGEVLAKCVFHVRQLFETGTQPIHCEGVIHLDLPPVEEKIHRARSERKNAGGPRIGNVSPHVQILEQPGREQEKSSALARSQ
jgi:hypothetical protein